MSYVPHWGSDGWQTCVAVNDAVVINNAVVAGAAGVSTFRASSVEGPTPTASARVLEWSTRFREMLD